MALIQGSSIDDINVGSGRLDGFCKSRTVPLFKFTLYTTPGVVVSKFTSNSLSNLSVIISRCNNPKNPHLKPSPNAEDDSASNEKLASFNCSFARPSLSF